MNVNGGKQIAWIIFGFPRVGMALWHLGAGVKVDMSLAFKASRCLCAADTTGVVGFVDVVTGSHGSCSAWCSPLQRLSLALSLSGD